MALTNQRATAQITVTNADGSPGQLDGVAVWSSSDETAGIVTPSADGMSADVDTVAPGTFRISVTGDADLGAGTIPLVGVSEDIVVTQNPATMASAITISLGAFADKP